MCQMCAANGGTGSSKIVNVLTPSGIPAFSVAVQAGVAAHQVVKVASIMGASRQLEEAVQAAYSEGYWLPPQLPLPITPQKQQQQAGKRRKSRSRRGPAGHAPFEPLSTVDSLEPIAFSEGAAGGSCGGYDSSWPLQSGAGGDVGGGLQEEGCMAGAGGSLQDQADTCFQDFVCDPQQGCCMDQPTCAEPQQQQQQQQGMCSQPAAAGLGGGQDVAQSRPKKRVHTAQERLAAVGMGLDPSALKLNAMQRLGIIANRGEAPSGPSARMQVRRGPHVLAVRGDALGLWLKPGFCRSATASYICKRLLLGKEASSSS